MKQQDSFFEYGRFLPQWLAYKALHLSSLGHCCDSFGSVESCVCEVWGSSPVESLQVRFLLFSCFLI